VIGVMRPRAVINAAAYTTVDKAEEEEALACLVNGGTPGALARACADLDIPFVHVSTDYVFDGTGTQAWRESDSVAPCNAYGRSKLLGEEAVRAAGGRYAIVRTSWVVSAHGNNFVKTMLRLGAERDRLMIVADQIGAPTGARDIARSCLEIARQLAEDPGKAGTYHYAGAPETSWAGFARKIFAHSGLGCEVEDVPTTAYPTPAPRPLNSRLDCALLETVFGISRPDWRCSLDEILKDLEVAT
jgi:dTDP-4-dehydrorhamnose reductase